MRGPGRILFAVLTAVLASGTAVRAQSPATPDAQVQTTLQAVRKELRRQRREVERTQKELATTRAETAALRATLARESERRRDLERDARRLTMWMSLPAVLALIALLAALRGRRAAATTVTAGPLDPGNRLQEPVQALELRLRALEQETGLLAGE
jgi:chromosome segregation ATPase